MKSPTTARLCLAALLAACQSTPTRPPLSDADYPGTLQPATALAVEAQWQQRVTARWQPPGEPAQERSFDAALLRRGDELVVLGISPMGSVGFSIRQTPAGIEVDNQMPEQLVIPPRFILLDVQRTFFPWLQPAPSPATHSGNARVGRRDGEEIGERFADGRLSERTFERLDGRPEGAITIRYRWQQPGWSVPSHVVLENGWFGYTLTIETISETLLGTAASGERVR